MHVKRRRGIGEEGVALLVSLIALMVVAGIGVLMFTRTLNEVRHSGDDARIVQTLLLARGGANLGSALMNADVKDGLYDIVLSTSKPGRWSFGKDPVTGVASSTPDPVEVAKDLRGVATRLQTAVDELVCGVNVLGGAEGSTVGVRIYFTTTACSGRSSQASLPSGVTLPDGRYVNGPARIEGLEIGVQEYALPFALVSEALLGDYHRNVVIQGEYIFSVGEAPFSHYAYFTNRETDKDPGTTGNRIYFTDNTMIDGPTHTNGNFSIHLTPWFGGAVTSAGCKFYTNLTTYRNTCENSPSTRTAGAYFNGATNLVAASNLTSPTTNNPSYTTGSGNSRRVHQPNFSAGVDWRAQFVPLPTNSHSQAAVARGMTADGSPRDDQGIFLDGDWDKINMWAGNTNGAQPTLQNGVWTPKATYQYITATRDRITEDYNCGTRNRPQTCTREVRAAETQEYRFNADGLLQRWNAATGSWIAEPKPFNGVIYVNGDVERLTGPARPAAQANAVDGGTKTPPAVAGFAQMTLAGAGDIRITSDLRYEDPPCSAPPTKVNGTVRAADCKNLAAANVLGIYTSGGDIKIGNDNNDSTLNAPKNVHIQAVLMSGTKQVRVENYTSPDRGNVFLLGGLIQENRGIFGQVGGNGYDRVFTYDPRMRQGMAPPFFPTTGLGSVQDVRYFSFGQREQLY